jgi:hypothetical protein
LVFGFFTVIISIGSILWFKSCYKKRIRYLIENKKNKMLGVYCHTMDSGIICFLFGATHQTLMLKPDIQLFLLLALEVFWMLHKLYFVKIRIYRKISIEWVMVQANFVRILFILTFYYYQHFPQEREIISNTVHCVLIVFFLFLWLC